MRTTHSTNCFRQAFTLLELLVVIAIIAIIISMLMPAISKARLAAVIAMDASQQRQIGIAVFAYAAQNNGYAPQRGGYGAADTPDGDVAGPGIFGPWSGPDQKFPYSAAPEPEGSSFGPGAGEPFGLGVLVPPGAKAEIYDGQLNGPGAKGNMRVSQLFGDYITIDALFNPPHKVPLRLPFKWQKLEVVLGQRIHYPSWWAHRDYFGDKFTGPDTPWNKDGLPTDALHKNSTWGWWNEGSNYRFDIAYNWRGADYTWYDPDINLGVARSWQQINPFTSSTVPWDNRPPFEAHNNPANAMIRLKNYQRARTDSTDFADHVILMNKDFDDLNPHVDGVNYLSGDGSVRHENSDQFLNHNIKSWYWAEASLNSRHFAAIDYYQGNR